MKKFLIAIAFLIVCGVVWAGVEGDQSSGDLIYRDTATRSTIMTIGDGSAGVTITTATVTNLVAPAASATAMTASTVTGTTVTATNLVGTNGSITDLTAPTVRATDIRFGNYKLVVATGTVSTGASTASITVTGTDSNDIVLATPNSAAQQAVRSAVPGTNAVVVTLEGNASGAATIGLLVFQD